MTELRRRFNEDAFLYDRYRPGYARELFEDIISYGDINASSALLEIGIGTGQATLPFLTLGCSVTAIELGDNLCAFAAEKFQKFRNFRILNEDFMTCPVRAEFYDLIYCATAFHWLPKKEACAKILRSLKKGGTLALFWNHPFPNRADDPTNAASQRVYARFRPTDNPPKEFCKEDCLPWVRELTRCGFADVESRLYRRTRVLDTEAYLGLLNTYSDHRSFDQAVREEFDAEMRRAIDEAGGRINIYDTMDLYLAKKP